MFTLNRNLLRTLYRHLNISVVRRNFFVTIFVKQLNALKQCIIERNAIIETAQRHLLVHEVTNKLLLAELDRRAVYRQRRRDVIRRWRTFNGCDSLCFADDAASCNRVHSFLEQTAPR